jgi:FdhE protein
MVLREEGHGSRRSLVCGFCLTERPFVRGMCPECGERRFDRLAVYRSEALPSAQVDGCDTCRTYVKTIDLTRDGTAVPIVDDLATVPLDLWAREQGYHRLRPNLLRL